MYVKDALKILGYKKRCSFNRWARLNNVGIYCDIGSNKHFVVLDEFHEALSSQPIRHISDLFAIKNQPERFHSYMKVDSEIRAYKDERASRKGVNNNKHYIPTGEHEKSFLTRLSKDIHEL